MNSIEAVLDAVEKEMGVNRASILAPSRGIKKLAWARQVAMYLYHGGTRSWSEVGRAFHRDRTTVRYAVEKVKANMTAEVLALEAQLAHTASTV
jgi:chromosomal replication initiation ATPase DnaA